MPQGNLLQLRCRHLQALRRAEQKPYRPRHVAGQSDLKKTRDKQKHKMWPTPTWLEAHGKQEDVASRPTTATRCCCLAHRALTSLLVAKYKPSSRITHLGPHLSDFRRLGLVQLAADEARSRQDRSRCDQNAAGERALIHDAPLHHRRRLRHLREQAKSGICLQGTPGRNQKPGQLPCASLRMWYGRAGAAPALTSMHQVGAGASFARAYS